MRAFLHPDFVLTGRSLRDRVLGTHYSLSEDAQWLLQRMRLESQLDALADRVSMEKQLPVHEAKAVILRFYSQLLDIGGLRVVWPGMSLRLRSWCMYRSRNSASAYGFLRSVLRAYGIPATVSFAGYFAVPALGEVLVVVLISCVLHELGHLLAVRACKSPVILLSRLAYMAVVYVPPASKIWRSIIALAGPVSGGICCLVAWAIGGDSIVLIVGLLHLCSLLPWSADGKSLWGDS